MRPSAAQGRFAHEDDPTHRLESLFERVTRREGQTSRAWRVFWKLVGDTPHTAHFIELVFQFNLLGSMVLSSAMTTSDAMICR